MGQAAFRVFQQQGLACYYKFISETMVGLIKNLQNSAVLVSNNQG